MKNSETANKIKNKYDDYIRRGEVREWYDAQKKWESDMKTKEHFIRQKGAYQAKIETARNLYRQGIVKDISAIAQATGLSEEELKKIL